MRLALLAAALLVSQGSQPAHAHEVPLTVTFRLFVHPEDDRLRVLARLPLEATQEGLFPMRGPGLLDFESPQLGEALERAAETWVVANLALFEERRPLEPLRIVGTRVSLPSDRSFNTHEGALALLRGPPLAATTQLPWRQAMLDVELETPIRSPQSRFAISPSHARLGQRVTTVLQYVPPGSERGSFSVRVLEYEGNPGLVRLDPRWYQAAGAFVGRGFFHILEGWDHLLFLFCLIIPARRLRDLVAVVTSFTVAHSITLVGAAYGLAPTALWFPALVELLIAASILYMALENILRQQIERRFVVTFLFGLVHGFGFSFVLRESLQFAGSHTLVSLLCFNLGVELGQVFVLVLLVPVTIWLLTHVVPRSTGCIVLSAFAAHSAWHWTTERGATVAAYRPELPVLHALPAELLPWVAPVVIVLVVGWRWWRSRTEEAGGEATEPSLAA